MALPRQPGQKEVRYVHLLGGDPDLSAYAAQTAGSPAATAPATTALSARVEALELAVELLQEELDALKSRLDPREDTDFA